MAIILPIETSKGRFCKNSPRDVRATPSAFTPVSGRSSEGHMMHPDACSDMYFSIVTKNKATNLTKQDMTALYAPEEADSIVGQAIQKGKRKYPTLRCTS
jgi:hypothetical protein